MSRESWSTSGPANQSVGIADDLCSRELPRRYLDYQEGCGFLSSSYTKTFIRITSCSNFTEYLGPELALPHLYGEPTGYASIHTRTKCDEQPFFSSFNLWT
jgi:hypothetical protein